MQLCGSRNIQITLDNTSVKYQKKVYLFFLFFL